MKKFVFLILFCAIALTGCTSAAQFEKQLAKQWIGKDANSLVASMGTPEKITDDGSGGQIYIYNKIKYSKLPESDRWQPTRMMYISKKGWHYSGVTNTKSYPPHTFIKGRKITFWINSTGQIYSVSIVR